MRYHIAIICILLVLTIYSLTVVSSQASSAVLSDKSWHLTLSVYILIIVYRVLILALYSTLYYFLRRFICDSLASLLPSENNSKNASKEVL